MISHSSPDLTAPAHGPIFSAQADNGGQVFQSAGPQTIYGRDVLHGHPVDELDLAVARQAFAEPSGMSKAREALRHYGVVVVVGRFGDGARTAGVRLLFEYASGEQRYLDALQTLTADWAVPSTARIPREQRMGYLLDLTEEDGELKSAFRRSLLSLGSELMSCGSRLVVVVAADQWSDAQQDQQLVPITAPLGRPDARSLVQKHIEHLHSRRDRLSRIDRPDVAEVLSAHARPVLAAAMARVLATAGENELDVDLAAVLDWPEYVRKCFNSDGDQWERALLWAVAALDGAPKRLVIDAARDLLERLNIKFDLGRALVKRDLTSCLTAIEAKQHEGTVSINRVMPGVAEVVLAHIWQEYVELREVLLEWLVGIGARGGVAASRSDEVSRALLTLAERDETSMVLNSLSAWVDDHAGRRELIARLLHDAAFEGSIKRSARALLLRWANSANAAQHAVVAMVCAGEFGRRFPERALVRLRWLFVKGDDESRRMAGDALRSLVVDGGLVDCAVLNAVLEWDAPAAVEAFSRVVTIEPETLPQLIVLLDPSHDQHAETTQVLIAGWRMVFGSGDNSDGQVAALRSWLAAAGTGSLPSSTIIPILRVAGSGALARSSVVKLAVKSAEGIGGAQTEVCAELIEGWMADVAANAGALGGPAE